jgi:uncharacterized BrkB/YihY/UPF0761 family membrane protein
MRDDCMGLSQQIAYSSLLAFFPAVAFLIGALSLFHLFDDVKQLLDSIAPSGVITFIDNLQQDSKNGASAAAFVLGFFGAVWAASGAMGTIMKAVNRAYDLQETRPFWKSRVVAIVLVLATGITTAGVFLLIVVGGSLGDAIAKKAGAAELEVGDAGLGRRQRALARALRPLRPVRDLRRQLHEDVRSARERHHPAALAQLLGVLAALRRRAQLRAGPPGQAC